MFYSCDACHKSPGCNCLELRDRDEPIIPIYRHTGGIPSMFIRAPFWWGLRAPTTLPALWALQPQPHCSAGLLLGHLGCLPAPPLPSSKPGPALSPPPGHQLKAQNKEPSCLQPYAPISRALPTPVSPSSDQQALNPLHHQQATGHQPITWQQPITRHQPTTQQRLVTHHQPITQQQPVTHH